MYVDNLSVVFLLSLSLSLSLACLFKHGETKPWFVLVIPASLHPPLPFSTLLQAPGSALVWPLLCQKSNPLMALGNRDLIQKILLCPHILSKVKIDHKYSNYKSLRSIFVH